jgi:hypothetical protein
MQDRYYKNWLAGIILVVVALPALAGPATISSGGTVQPGFQDIKGEAVIGSGTVGGKTLQLGGIYTLLPTAAGTPEVPAGTVKLYISRSGTNIQITWEATKYPNPQIFILTGDGSGQYHNSYDATKWKSYDNPIFDTTPMTFDASDRLSGILTHYRQVGGGDAEVYYKGLLAGITDYGKYLPSAEAVGKVNFELNKTGASSWNFISSCLTYNNIDQVLGVNFTNGDQLWFWNNVEQKFYPPITFSDGTWGTGNLNPGPGYLLNLVGTSPKPVTAIGKVNTAALDRAISVKPLTPSYGWNVIGNPRPILSLMTGFGAGRSGAGDSLWEWDSSNQKFLPPLVFDGTKWPTGAKLLIMKGYGYNHTGSGFSWQVPALAP